VVDIPLDSVPTRYIYYFTVDGSPGMFINCPYLRFIAKLNPIYLGDATLELAFPPSQLTRER